MGTCISKSPEDTEALGFEWGKAVQTGWVFGLTGELGAGKTQLVKGIAKGLGITQRVTSPTFTLVHEYKGGRLPLFHLDLYRLDTPSQIISAGLEDYFYNPPGVSVVEWVERWLGAGPRTSPSAAVYRRVRIESTGENERRISYEDFGA